MRPVLVELDSNAGATSKIASHLLTPGESVTVAPGVKLIRSRWGSSVAAVSSGGGLLLDSAMDALGSRYLELTVPFDGLPAARALQPIHERQLVGRSVLLFDRVDRERLAALGEVRVPDIVDLFVALIGKPARDEPRGPA